MRKDHGVRYEGNRLDRMALKEVKKKNEVTRIKLHRLRKTEFINVEVEKCKNSLRVADDIIDDAKTKLEEALACDKLANNKSLVQQALAKLDVGTEMYEEDIDVLNKKRKKLLSTLKN